MVAIVGVLAAVAVGIASLPAAAGPAETGVAWLPAAAGQAEAAVASLPAAGRLGEAAVGAPQAAERIVGVRFHGNYSTTDDELLAAAGIEIGASLTAESLALIEQRLRGVQGVGQVEIRKRYRSMASTEDVVLVILIEQHVAVVEKFMFLPVFTWTDEYGITYGARFTWIDLLGASERISTPLTWGGDKQARAELSFDLDTPAISRFGADFGVLRRTNPHFDLDDTRVGGRVEAAKRWGSFELDAGLTAEDVTFGDVDTSQIEFGAGARIDTRQDAVLPRNAVYAGVAWDRLDQEGSAPGVNRYTVDLRGYKSVIGHTILATQAYWRGADARLPDWERPFLGGARTLRGYEAGAFIGDNIALLSTELRVPITHPAPVGIAGLNFFFDAGTVYDDGVSLRKARWYRGAGAGFYVFVAFIGFQFDVAYGFDSEEVHAHFSTGFRF